MRYGCRHACTNEARCGWRKQRPPLTAACKTHDANGRGKRKERGKKESIHNVPEAAAASKVAKRRREEEAKRRRASTEARGRRSCAGLQRQTEQACARMCVGLMYQDWREQ
jgi:hypothetical protein